MSDSLLVDVIQIVSTVIAFVALAVSFWFSRRQLVLQELQSRETAAQAAAANAAAQAAAQRAAASAALTIDDLSRIAVAIERLAAGPAHPAGFGASAGVAAAAFESAGAHQVASWRLTAGTPGRFLLTNVGGAAAYEVWVGGSASLDGPHGVPAGATVAPGASLPFTAQVLPTTIDSTLTVTWADVAAPSAVGGVTASASDSAPERHSWRYPLPGV